MIETLNYQAAKIAQTRCYKQYDGRVGQRRIVRWALEALHKHGCLCHVRTSGGAPLLYGGILLIMYQVYMAFKKRLLNYTMKYELNNFIFSARWTF